MLNIASCIFISSNIWFQTNFNWFVMLLTERNLDKNLGEKNLHPKPNIFSGANTPPPPTHTHTHTISHICIEVESDMCVWQSSPQR